MANISDGEQVGFSCVLAYNTGTHAIPVWVTVTRAKDVSVTSSKSQAEISSRHSKFKYYKGALIDLGIEFGYQYERGTDTVWSMLSTSFLTNAVNEFWVGDDLITLVGAKGVRMYGEVMEFPYDQPLEEAMTYKVTIKPSPNYVSAAIVEPDIYTIS